MVLNAEIVAIYAGHCWARSSARARERTALRGQWGVHCAWPALETFESILSHFRGLTLLSVFREMSIFTLPDTPVDFQVIVTTLRFSA